MKQTSSIIRNISDNRENDTDQLMKKSWTTTVSDEHSPSLLLTEKIINSLIKLVY